MNFPGFFELRPDAKRRIQRGHRTLQDEPNFFAAKRSNFSLAESHQVTAIELDRTVGLASLQIKKFQDSQRQRALAAAALPDQTKDLLPADLQRQIAQHPELSWIVDRESQ